MKKILIYNSFSNMMPELIVWMIYLQNFGWHIAEIAILQGVFTFFSAIFELPSGIIADKIGYKRALQLGELICIFYLISYFFPYNHIVVYIGFVCFALGLSLISGTDTSLLYNVTNDNKFLKYMGFFNSLGILSVAFGNLIGGWLAEKSWIVLFLISILFRVVALICITSVSYTHLDVYKRQILFRVVALICITLFDTPKTTRVDSITEKNKAIKLYVNTHLDVYKRQILFRVVALICITSVSYTHLDVYKRQALICITLFDTPKTTRVDSITEKNKAIKLYVKRLYDFVKMKRTFKYILISSAFLMSSVTLSYQYMPVVLKQLKIATGHVSLIYAVVSVLGALLSFFSAKLTNHLSSRVVAFIIFFISSLLFVGLGIFPYHSIITILCFMIPNILYELLSVIIDSAVHEDLIDDIRASSISLINFVNSILLAAGSLLVSLLSNLLNLQITLCLICTTLMLLSLLSYIEYEKK
ncbi:MFS transporter [Enterococcus cecorum]|nr:MFS transporter [Enterococcus cecorum]